MQRLLAFLCVFPWLLSCDKLQNRLNSQVLECGKEARDTDGSWIKVLDPEGLELPETELLDARVLQIDPAGALPSMLPVSEKHCVNVRRTEPVVIRSLVPNRSWSVMVSDAEPWPEAVRLQDQSQQHVRLRCPSPWINNGVFNLPLEITPGTRLEALAFAPRLALPDGREVAQSFGVQDTALLQIWPQDWPDGAGRLSLRQRNYLKNPGTSLAETEESCDLVIDRENPILQLTPAPLDGQILEVQPGSLVRIQIVDAHPAQLQWCLQKSDEEVCAGQEVWQKAEGEASLSMPGQGRWLLQARAVDAAGNASTLLRQPIEVVQRDVIHTIAARVDQALAETAQNSWQSTVSLLRALVDYQRLVLPSEQKLVKNKLVDGILTAATSIHESQRVSLPGSGRRVWSLGPAPDSPWLALTSTELSMWSAEGRLITRIQVPLALAADWSSSQQALALGTGEELLIVRVQGSSFLAPLTLRWLEQSIFGGPLDVKWIPGSRDLVAAISGDLPVILHYDDRGLSVKQRLDLKNVRRLAVAPDGIQIAGTDTDVVNVWRLENAGWKTVASDEQPVADLQFTRAPDPIPSRLLIQHRDGRLTSWSPGVLWKEIDPGVPGEEPADIENDHVQSWSDGFGGLMERGKRFYYWSHLAEKTLVPVELHGFAWDALRSWKVDSCQKAVWLQDDRTLSYWEWQEGTQPYFKKMGEWITGPGDVKDFSMQCHPDDRRFVTLDASQLRFWSQRGPLPLMRGDTITTVVSAFNPGRSEGEVLFTAGFDGQIRLWDRQGQKVQEWTGHTGQINEVRWLPDWQQFTSSAEDGTSRLWSATGASSDPLRIKDIPGVGLRDGLVAFDSQTLLSGGSGVLALWTKEPNRTKLTITIPLVGTERTGFDSLKRLPGPTRILVRILASRTMRGLIVYPDGTTQTREQGLPALENLKWLEWSGDASRLALMGADQIARIYSYTQDGWQEEPFGRLGITRFTFAPNSQSFAATDQNGQLILGRLAQGRWQTIQTSLPSRVDLESGLRWTADGSRIVYAQNGKVFFWNDRLEIEHQFQAFPKVGRLSSFGLSQDPNVLAVGDGPWVRLIDLDLQHLQSRLCGWLDAYLEGPDAPAEIVALCT